jgi:hypothetical protein
LLLHSLTRVPSPCLLYACPKHTRAFLWFLPCLLRFPCQAMRYPPNAFRTNSGEDAVIEDVEGKLVVDSEDEDLD